RNMQARFSRQVDYIAFAFRNPFTAPSLLWLGVQRFIASGFGALKSVPDLARVEAEIQDLSKTPYDPNAYKSPVGVGVMLSVLFLAIFVLIHLLR
ncbi:MAG: hypothetical protein JRJ48_07770, partial [Deltaproteobacteria bacterium]|nr:hypothetical protein [Deltaproteobacteria bacterium]